MQLDTDGQGEARSAPVKPTEISRHEVAVYKALLNAGDTWLSNKQIAELADVSLRTARAHTLKLVRLGVLDQAEVSPGYRYRMAGRGAGRNHAYVARLNHAAQALGVALEPA